MTATIFACCEFEKMLAEKKNFRRNGFSRAVLERDFLEPNPCSGICIYRREIFPENLVALRCVVVLILAIMSVIISHSDSCQHNIARTAVLRYDSHTAFVLAVVSFPEKLQDQA